jgi:hypothetical protein
VCFSCSFDNICGKELAYTADCSIQMLPVHTHCRCYLYDFADGLFGEPCSCRHDLRQLYNYSEQNQTHTTIVQYSHTTVYTHYDCTVFTHYSIHTCESMVRSFEIDRRRDSFTASRTLFTSCFLVSPCSGREKRGRGRKGRQRWAYRSTLASMANMIYK